PDRSRMSLVRPVLGVWSEWSDLAVDQEWIEDYRRATNDTSVGAIASPVFAVVPVGETLRSVLDTALNVPDDVAGLHGEQDIVVHGPIVAGMHVRSRARTIGVRQRSTGTTVAVQSETRTRDGTLLNEQYWTVFLPGFADESSRGEEPPHFDAPRAEGEPTHVVTCPTSIDQASRYALASG